MRKLTTILLSLLMAFTLCLSVSAEDNNDDDLSTQATSVAKIGDTEYATLQEAIAAASDGDAITILQDMTLDDSFTLVKDLTIDLGGHTIEKINASGNNYLFDIYSDVTLKNGTFKRDIEASAMMWVNYDAKLTIESDLNIIDSKLYGIALDQSCNGATVTIKGKLSGKAGLYVNGNINKNNTINLEGATINSDAYGLYLAGYTTTTINNTTINAKTTAIEIRAGKLTINSGSFTGGNTFGTDPNGNGTTVEGAALAVSQHTTLQPIDVTVNGGTFKGSYGLYQGNVQGNSDEDANKVVTKIVGGDFDGQFSIENNPNESVSGGTFSSDISKYLKEGYNVAKISGKFIVVKDGEKAPVTEKVTPAVDEKVFDVVKDSNGDGTTAIVLESQEKQLNVDEKTMVDQKVKEDVDLKDKDVEYLPLDLTLVAYKGVERSEIHELSSPITVTLYLDDATAAKLQGKIVKVIRIHDDEVKILPATLSGNALTFETDKFSTYTIVYEATPATPSTDNKSYDPKDKNHDGIISCDEEMNSSNWVWSENKKACVYKVTNTSVR